MSYLIGFPESVTGPATPNRGRSEATKALAVLLYSFGKASFRWLGKLLGVSGVSAYQ